MINDQIPIAKPQVLIVGAGLAGMIAAHHLAEWGAQAHLVDSAPHIGGAFLLLDHAFTTDSCGLCIALLRHGPRSVDPDRCDNCGDCAAVCPATRPLTSETRFSGESGA